MTYLFLILAIGTEVIATGYLKNTNGFTRILPTLFCLTAYLICHFAFSKVVLKMNLGIAYALWCGVGILITTLISVFLYHEKISLRAALGILLVCIGCILVNLGNEAGN